jgi:hypothetical protein
MVANATMLDWWQMPQYNTVGKFYYAELVANTTMLNWWQMLQ